MDRKTSVNHLVWLDHVNANTRVVSRDGQGTDSTGIVGLQRLNDVRYSIAYLAAT
jgi:hypothetical protein